MSQKFEHTPVMLREVIENMNINPNGIYVDCTVGLGGHSFSILEKLDQGALLGFDKDQKALVLARERLQKLGKKFQFFHSDFSRIQFKLSAIPIKKVDGILVDLGMSSMQIADDNRGFSYHVDAPLDMRMNQDQKYSAFNVINELSYTELVKIIFKNTGSPYSAKLTKTILENRPIKTTFELNEVMRKALPAKLLRKKHPGKTFYQAFRIEVNAELESLKISLSQFVDLLKKGGVLQIITFHSIEDRVVKKFFQELIAPKYAHDIPVMERENYKIKTFYPSDEEVKKNPRARSARLRILTKLID